MLIFNTVHLVSVSYIHNYYILCVVSLLKVEVEHCCQEDNDERRLFKENLMEELKEPYCKEEHKRLLHDITVQKQVQRHRECAEVSKSMTNKILESLFLLIMLVSRMRPFSFIFLLL